MIETLRSCLILLRPYSGLYLISSVEFWSFFISQGVPEPRLVEANRLHTFVMVIAIRSHWQIIKDVDMDVWDDLSYFIKNNRWAAPLLFLGFFILVLFASNGCRLIENHERLIILYSNEVIISSCFSILAVSIAEIICWRSLSFKVYCNIETTDEEANRIKELAYSHLISWVSWQGITILVISLAVILIYLLNDSYKALTIIADFAFVALLLYWAFYTALLFYFSWFSTVSKNFQKVVVFYAQYPSFRSSFNTLNQAIDDYSGSVKTKDSIKFLHENRVFNNEDIKKYKDLVSFMESVRRSGYKKGLKERIIAVRYLLDVINNLKDDSNNAT